MKLLDFGLAKAFALGTASPDISHTPTVAVDATRQGLVLGTASYMSPEQTRSRALDARSDLWSFGCVLYEMLAGRKAFDGESVSDILVAILDREPDWSALPAVSPALLGALRQLLQKDPAKRPASVREARTLLESAAGSHTTAVHPPALRKSAATPRLAAAAALVAVLGGAGYLLFHTPTGSGALPKEKYLAILPFKDLSGRPDGQLIVDGLADSFAARLTKVGGGLQVMAPPRDRGGPAPADIAKVARNQGANILLECSYRVQGATARLTYKLIAPSSLAILTGDEVEGPASDQFALEDRLFDSVLASLRLQLKGTGGAAAASAATLAQRPVAGEPYFRALGLLQRYDDPKSLAAAAEALSTLPGGEKSALVQAALGRTYIEQYRMEKDPADASRARAAVERAIALDDRLPESHLALGQLLLLTGKPKEAVVEFRKALERQAQSADATLPLADALARAGAPAEAEAAYREAIALNPEYWAGYSRLGNFFYQRGDMSKALELFRTAAAKNPSSSRGESNVGAALLRLGRLDEAEAAFRKAVELAPKPDALSYSNLGTSQYLAGRSTEAAASFERAAAASPNDFKYRIYLADAYRFAPGLEGRAEGGLPRGPQARRGRTRRAPARRGRARDRRESAGAHGQRRAGRTIARAGPRARTREPDRPLPGRHRRERPRPRPGGRASPAESRREGPQVRANRTRPRALEPPRRFRLPEPRRRRRAGPSGESENTMSEPPRNELDFERVVTISYNRDKTGLVVEPESVPVHLGLRERVRWVTAVPNARLEIEWKDKVTPFREFASGGAQAVSGEAGSVPGGERTPRGNHALLLHGVARRRQEQGLPGPGRRGLPLTGGVSAAS